MSELKPEIASREFKQDDCLLLYDNEQLSYRRRANDEKKSVPWGQRKLLLTEIQFLTNFWDPSKIAQPIIVYAGAAPGRHIPFLSHLFPDIIFHLYDPKPFHIKESDKIHIHQKYFTNGDAENWSGRNDVFFISDIRTANYREMNAQQNENTILKDMYRQQKWYYMINPVKAHLKFRLPYVVPGLPRQVTYLNGELYKQPWAPQTSTETRLVPYSKDQTTWDTLKYESQMFYYNVIIREKYRYKNPFTNNDEPIDYPELMNDQDSVYETYILKKYLEKQLKTDNVDIDKVSELSKLITSKLNDNRQPENWYSLSKLRNDTFLIKRRYNEDEDDAI